MASKPEAGLQKASTINSSFRRLPWKAFNNKWTPMNFRLPIVLIPSAAMMLSGFASPQTSTPAPPASPQQAIPHTSTPPTTPNPGQQGIDYDIVAVSFDRDPNAVVTSLSPDFPDASNHSLHIARGANLVVVHPDGSTDCLVNPITLNDTSGATNFPNGACVDPTVSFDGTFVLFCHFEDPQNFQAGQQTSLSPSQIYKVDVATKQVTQLTFGDDVEYEDTANKIYPEFAQFNVAPIELADGRILFLSNRHGVIGINQVLPAMRFFRMNADGSNVEALENFTLGNCQHPYILRDGRVVWTHSHGAGRRFMANGNYPLMVANPDMSDFKSFAGMHMKDSAYHFTTQLSPNRNRNGRYISDGDVATTAYYHQNNWGHGAILRFPLAPVNPVTTMPYTNLFTPLFEDPSPVYYNLYGHEGHTQGIVEYEEGNDHFDRVGELVSTPWAFGAALWEDKNSPGGVGKATMPSGVEDGGMLFSFSPGNVNSKVAHYGPPHMKIAFSANGMLPNPAQIPVILTNPNKHFAYPKALVTYKSIHGIAKPVLIPDTINDGTPLPGVLPAGGPFATMGTSSLYNRESSWPESYDNSWDGSIDDDYRQYMAIFNVGQDTRYFDNEDIFAAQVVVDMSHVGNGTPYVAGNAPNFKSHNNGDQIWAILGEVAVRKFDERGNQIFTGNFPDTSYEVRVPADVPMHNRIIDSNGLVLTSEATWHAPRPGERKNNCGGCHAHSIDTQPLNFENFLAASMPVVDFALETPVLTKNSSTNELEFSPLGTKLQIVEFNEHVLPIINAKCVSCHDPAHPTFATHGLDLTVSDLYDVLAYGTYVPQPGDTKSYPQDRVHQATRWVRRTSAAQSLLVWAAYRERLDGQPDISPDPDDLDFYGHPQHNLTFDEMRVFASWVDLGSLVNLSDHGPIDNPTIYDVWDDQMRPTLVVSGIDSANSTLTNGTIIVSAYDLHSDLDSDSLFVKAESAAGHVITPSTPPISDGDLVNVDLSSLATTYAGEWTITISVADDEESADPANPTGNIARRVFTVNL